MTTRVQGICELPEGEILSAAPVVRSQPLEVEVGIRDHDRAGFDRDPEKSRAHLVLTPGVRAGGEVTGRARLHSVAAPLHIPEQRLPEDLGGPRVAYEIGQVRRPGNWESRQRRDLRPRFSSEGDPRERHGQGTDDGSTLHHRPRRRPLPGLAGTCVSALPPASTACNV